MMKKPRPLPPQDPYDNRFWDLEIDKNGITKKISKTRKQFYEEMQQEKEAYLQRRLTEYAEKV